MKHQLVLNLGNLKLQFAISYALQKLYALHLKKSICTKGIEN